QGHGLHMWRAVLENDGAVVKQNLSRLRPAHQVRDMLVLAGKVIQHELIALVHGMGEGPGDLARALEGEDEPKVVRDTLRLKLAKLVLERQQVTVPARQHAQRGGFDRAGANGGYGALLQPRAAGELQPQGGAELLVGN